jgi:hypothetical protein
VILRFTPLWGKELDVLDHRALLLVGEMRKHAHGRPGAALAHGPEQIVGRGQFAPWG